MGHNRGWEEAASMFSGASVELKTCNAALLEAAGKSWEEVRLLFLLEQHLINLHSYISLFNLINLPMLLFYIRFFN